MEETHNLRTELVMTKHRNRELRKQIGDLITALEDANITPPVSVKETKQLAKEESTLENPLPGTSSVRVAPTPVVSAAKLHEAAPTELAKERAKGRALEQRLVDIEAKATSKLEELLQVITALNRKLEVGEKNRVSLESSLSKVTHQKRELEKKLLSMQGPDRSLICHNTDWILDSRLWAATNDFLALEVVPMLSLCAGETVESLTTQLKLNRKHLDRAKELLYQHQEHLTNLIAAMQRPCPCRTSMDAAEANEVGETIDTLFQKIQAQQEIIQAKEDELNQLKNKKTALDSESDKIGILQSQIIVYQSDFLAEKKAREEAIADRDRLFAEIKLIKDENKRLAAQSHSQGTSTSSKNTQLNNIQVSPTHIIEPGKSDTEVRSPPRRIYPTYVCPNPECSGKKFEDMFDLQNHVYKCLELVD